MVFSPFVEVGHQLWALKPAFISKNPHFTFITIHYFWIIGTVIITSILIYPVGNLSYVDALFLASGACTQSGLNTIDLNLLKTYQQIVLILFPILTNPITINTFVVFLRLYWFEKRFQHIAKEAKHRRRTISKTRSQMRGERDIGNEEKGVAGREIVVMHNTPPLHSMAGGLGVDENSDLKTMKADIVGDIQNVVPSGGSEASSKGESTVTEDLKHDLDLAPHQTQIKFAEQVTRSDGLNDEPLRRPPQWTERDHIAVLERQRNPLDRGVLRIPGPRDAEKGVAPQTLEEEEAFKEMIQRRDSNFDPRRASESDLPVQTSKLDSRTSNGDHGPTRAIIIAEPTRQDSETAEENAKAAVHTLSIFRLRKPRLFTGSKTHKDNSHLHPTPSRAKTFASFRASGSRDKNELAPYLSWQPTIGRNSAFVDLTEEQREELGGIEYRSLKSLALILVIYYWGFTILGLISLVPWIHLVDRYGSVVDEDGQNRTWWGFFTTTSVFNDVGFTLTPDSMISFQSAIWPLLLMSFLIIIGNTGFPIMLRWIIWVTSKYMPQGSGFWEELRFLLDHPRRCFTLLFPSKATWWLFWILVILNGVDLLFFIILDLGNPTVETLPVNVRILDGWFQAVATRTAGFTVVNLAALHPAIQVSYLIMMYISVLPIAISVRRTNVYEEKSLGLYGSPAEESEEEGEPSYVGAHLRRQLSFDLWYIFLGFFIITLSEGKRIQSGDSGFTMFAILFEIISAYGTVGLSLGYPTINSSFSTELGVIGKLVIIAMEIRGRHRGLPYELDRAILLPSESLHAKEDQDAARRVRRRNSGDTGSGLNPVQSDGSSASRARSRDRTVPHLLSKLMHPGPVMPPHHRQLRRVHTHAEGTREKDSGPQSPGLGLKPLFPKAPSI